MSKNKDLLDPSEIGTAPKRKEKKATDSTQPAIPVTGLFGLGLFLVAISIGYANYMVYFGTEFSVANVALLTPSTLFVAALSVYKFIK